jgi:hypothetical protein
VLILKNGLLRIGIVLLLISPLVSNNNFLAYPYENNTNISLSGFDYSDWFWTDIEVLTDVDDDSSSVKIAADEANNLHIVWADDTDDLLSSGVDQDIFYMNWNSETETWSDFELVSNEGTSYSQTPDLAIDSDGNIHVIFLDYVDILGAGTDLDVWHRVRSSGGTWSSYSLISDASTSTITLPRITIDDSDNVYIAWADATDVGDLGGADYDIFFNMYDSQSSTWLGMTLVSEDALIASIEPFLATDSQGFVHLAWTDYTDMLSSGADIDIFYKKFVPSLMTWSTTQLISSESTDESRNARMCVDAEDSLHVFWDDESDYDFSGTDFDIFYKMYDTSVSSWTTTEVISIYSNDWAALAIPAIDDKGTLHLVWEDWTDYLGSGSDWDVVYQYKEKDSNTLSQLTHLSLDPDSTSYEPRICVDNLGHIHLVCYDDTDYLGSGTDLDVFYRKFVGPPEETVLTPFDTDSVELGNLSLSWQEAYGAENYQVYRENSYINSYAFLSPIAILTDTQYTDTLNETGDYYYSVLAANRFGESDLSNVEQITVLDIADQGLFGTFNLSEILILASILGGFQILIAAIVITLSKAFSSQSKSGRKK